MPERPCRRYRPHPEAGFTLLELLVVITILVLLTVAAGSVAINYLGRARADAAQLQMDRIETGLDLFHLDIGRYPTETEGLAALLEAPAGVERWQGPYLADDNIVRDPWDTTMVYALGADGTPLLISLGADGLTGGEGDAADISN